MMMLTFILTLILGIEAGVFCGMIMSLLWVLYRSSKPSISILGNIPGTPHYKNLERYERAQGFEDCLIVRFEDQLYFANSEYFRLKINSLIDNQPYKIRYVIVDFSIINAIDSTALHMLEELDIDLKARNIELHLSGAIGRVRDSLHLAGLLSEKDKHHVTIHNAIQSIKGLEANTQVRGADPFQTNAR